MLVGVAVAVEGLVLVGGEYWVDADELADGRVVFAGADVGEAGGLVGGLVEEASVGGPGADGTRAVGAEGGQVASGGGLGGVGVDGEGLGAVVVAGEVGISPRLSRPPIERLYR